MMLLGPIYKNQREKNTQEARETYSKYLVINDLCVEELKPDICSIVVY